MTKKDWVVVSYVGKGGLDIGTGHGEAFHGWLPKFYFLNWYWLE